MEKLNDCQKAQNNFKDLDSLYKECVYDLKKINIPIRDLQVVSVTHEDNFEDAPFAGNCKGICRCYHENEFSISIHTSMLDGRVRDCDLKAVICHELIHTCDGCFDHSAKFRKYAKMADEAYGYGIMDGYDDYMHPDKEILDVLKCKCGYTFYYRDEKRSQNVRELKEMMPKALPRCKFCRKVMYYVEKGDG